MTNSLFDCRSVGELETSLLSKQKNFGLFLYDDDFQMKARAKIP